MPGQLDFARMRRAAGLPEGAEILAGIAQLPEDAQDGAWAAVEQVEIETMGVAQLQPGLVALITALRARGLRMVRPLHCMLMTSDGPPHYRRVHADDL